MGAAAAVVEPLIDEALVAGKEASLSLNRTSPVSMDWATAGLVSRLGRGPNDA